MTIDDYWNKTIREFAETNRFPDPISIEDIVRMRAMFAGGAAAVLSMIFADLQNTPIAEMKPRLLKTMQQVRRFTEIGRAPCGRPAGS